MFLVNYRHSNCEPLKSITQLPKDEAVKLAKKLYSENPCRGHNRFGLGFAEYYDDRIKMEQWLYEQFIAIGGEPQVKNPFYFTLCFSENLYENFNSGKVITISLTDIAIMDISFTLNDSMAKFYSADWKKPLLKDQLYEIMSEYEDNVEKFLISMQPKYLYVEAQLWTEKYFVY